MPKNYSSPDTNKDKDIFLCPDCKRLLLEIPEAYCCPNCKRSYRIINGIIELLPKEIPESSIEDIRAWDDRKSGRAEHQPSWLALLSKEAEVRQMRQIVTDYFKPGRILEVGGGCVGGLC